MISLIAMLLALALLLTLTTGFAEGEKYRVAYFNREDTDEYLNQFCTGVQTLCEADDTIAFTRYNGESDANNQLAQVEDAINRGVDLIILSVQDKETMVSKVKQCNELGIPVICIDISMDHGDDYYFDFVGSNNYDLGFAEGAYAAEVLPENAKLLYFRFTPGSVTSNLRHDGILAGLASTGRTDIEILTTMEYNATQAKAMSLMEDQIQVYGSDWDGLITHNDKGTYGCISAMQAAGIDPTTKQIFSIDGEEIACNLIKAGQMTVTCQSKRSIARENAAGLQLVWQGRRVDEKRVGF